MNAKSFLFELKLITDSFSENVHKFWARVVAINLVVIGSITH